MLFSAKSLKLKLYNPTGTIVHPSKLLKIASHNIWELPLINQGNNFSRISNNYILRSFVEAYVNVTI